MKTASMVLGIIGGVLALLLGLVGYTVGGLATGRGVAAMRAISLALPVVALVGASIVNTRSQMGGLLMIGVAVAIMAVLGVNFASLLPGIPLIVAGIMGVIAEREKTA